MYVCMYIVAATFEIAFYRFIMYVCTMYVCMYVWDLTFSVVLL